MIKFNENLGFGGWGGGPEDENIFFNIGNILLVIFKVFPSADVMIVCLVLPEHAQNRN